MNSGLSALYKILKDENRQQIIKALKEKGSQSYTELLESSETGSTGLLNYHLKVLGDLVAKDETGHYKLTEKGKVAFSVLVNFPHEVNIAQRKRAQKIFWSILFVGQIITLAVFSALYYLGVIDSSHFLQVIIGACTGLFLAYFGYKMLLTVPAPDSDQMKKRMRIAYPLGGAWIAFVMPFLVFFVGGALCGIFANPLLQLPEVQFLVLFFMCVIAPVIGGFWGNWVGKRNNYNQPKWIVWMNKKTGFA
jgi:threonine/homoserine/homoserine lactone efflux protein